MTTTTANILRLVTGALLLVLGLFILTDLFEQIIDYVAYAMIGLGSLAILATLGYIVYLVRFRRE